MNMIRRNCPVCEEHLYNHLIKNASHEWAENGIRAALAQEKNVSGEWEHVSKLAKTIHKRFS